ncbi:hypothetical protein ED92_23875 [Amycolatopsis sp. MJM2582]|uniref:hypothetical protein n=1 Tax=Amycolatopsis TaxID=1813 RepID=UPI000501EA1A|nr:hypothetical protein [Amycolatopsis sp. MJM2582]KFZ80397.1 hypothetical protein ED92_23875 [Amycolatopsis sp. MJM2582]
MGLGDYTDGNTEAMEVFSQRVVAIAQEVPEGALRRVVEPACAGGLDQCGEVVRMDALVTKELQKFITDVGYGLSAYAMFVRNEGTKYLAAAEDAKKEILKNLAQRQDTGLPEVSPEFPPAVVQPK